MKKTILAVAFAAGVLALVALLRGGGDSRPPVDDQKVMVKASGRHAPDVVLSIVPGTPSEGRLPAQKARSSSPLAEDFYAGRHLREMYDRLSSAAARTAEETFVLAAILRSCGQSRDHKPVGQTTKVPPEVARQRFLASLPEKDPFRGERIRAHERLARGEGCQGLESLQYSERELDDLLQVAARGGSAAARAMAIERAMFERARQEQSLRLTEREIDDLKEIVASGDHRALMDAIAILTSPFSNFSLRAGPEELPVSGAALNAAAILVSCDLGRDCSAEAPELLAACAYQGRCAATSYRDHLFFYQLPPGDSQLVDQYSRGLGRAARERDWSYFSFVRRPDPRFASVPADDQGR